MPIYEYECRFCSYKFQLLQKMSDSAPSICPNCKKEGGIHKLVSPVSFTLKGSGWYVTDYKQSGSVSQGAKSEHKSETKAVNIKKNKSKTNTSTSKTKGVG